MATIFLSTGEMAIVDDVDAALVSQHKWHRIVSHGLIYAGTWLEKRKLMLMHRLLIGAQRGEITDHRNGNGLDNRRKNLRICSHAENIRNQAPNPNRGVSQYKGVYRRKERNAWVTQLTIGGKKIRRQFPTERDAAIYYDSLAVQYFGEFARLNFPQ